jgi:putative flippase GtrA
MPERSSRTQTVVKALTTAQEQARTLAGRVRSGGEHLLLTRYVLVSGAFGVPASIIQLQVMIWAYETIFGDYNRLTLNLMWILNFEFSLVRNYLLHCRFTWKTNPTRRRFVHVHVAAIGAFVIDIVAFNVVHAITGVVLIAQIFGASSGFLCNFLYNRFRTFGAPTRKDEAITEGAIV